MYCIICYINRHTQTSHMHYANIHSSLSKSYNVGAMSDPIISAILAFSTELLSLWGQTFFFYVSSIHPFFSFSFFLILTYLFGLKLWHTRNRMVQVGVNKGLGSAHVQDAGVSGNWGSRMPAEADFSQSCVILAKEVRLQPCLSWPHSDKLWF